MIAPLHPQVLDAAEHVAAKVVTFAIAQTFGVMLAESVVLDQMRLLASRARLTR